MGPSEAELENRERDQAAHSTPNTRDEHLPAERRDHELPRLLHRHEPALLLVVVQQCRAQCTGDVRPALGPVGAAAEERAARAFQPLQVDAKIGEDGVARLQKALGDAHAQLPGEVVVAAACEAHLARRRAAADRRRARKALPPPARPRCPAMRKYFARPLPCQTRMLAATSFFRCALAVCGVTPASRASFLALRDRPSISASTMAARRRIGQHGGGGRDASMLHCAIVVPGYANVHRNTSTASEVFGVGCALPRGRSHETQRHPEGRRRGRGLWAFPPSSARSRRRS